MSQKYKKMLQIWQKLPLSLRYKLKKEQIKKIIEA
ncbi:MAG: hypothetical protein GY750_05490 [Lentisphaerae bacterium]|nr:hypothetical protein [Lentisphaerota bacterium]MCP4100864.1 hypothetical protein [Lentisphaerota bacterium]